MEQIRLLKRATEVMEVLAIPYALVGSWASGIYGEPRFTRDIDIVIELQQSAIRPFSAAFPPDEYYVSVPSIEDAVREHFQFNIVHPESGNKIDFILPRPHPWNSGQLSRRRRVTIGTGADIFSAYIAAPEDVIIGKLWYYSEGGGDRHLRDIAGILRITGEGVDRAEIEHWAQELGYLDVWRQVVAKADAPDLPPGPGQP